MPKQKQTRRTNVGITSQHDETWPPRKKQIYRTNVGIASCHDEKATWPPRKKRTIVPTLGLSWYVNRGHDGLRHRTNVGIIVFRELYISSLRSKGGGARRAKKLSREGDSPPPSGDELPPQGIEVILCMFSLLFNMLNSS
ncbi:hypothetical protein L195_g051259 [Trifolium pratense]|uniref:Uncharacterized protein n=1 Tax=Trifolium pratense TaxID=57577 RepID=A0A2K3JYP7_TRIPR|nr:hypothetical protein L195_g051259 [Trifolium pratense]